MMLKESMRLHDVLCEEILGSLGFPERERSRLVGTRYFTQSYIDQQTILIESLKGIPKIADATARIAAGNEMLANGVTAANSQQRGQIAKK